MAARGGQVLGQGAQVAASLVFLLHRQTDAHAARGVSHDQGPARRVIDVHRRPVHHGRSDHADLTGAREDRYRRRVAMRRQCVEPDTGHMWRPPPAAGRE